MGKVPWYDYSLSCSLNRIPIPQESLKTRREDFSTLSRFSDLSGSPNRLKQKRQQKKMKLYVNRKSRYLAASIKQTLESLSGHYEARNRSYIILYGK